MNREMKPKARARGLVQHIDYEAIGEGDYERIESFLEEVDADAYDQARREKALAGGRGREGLLQSKIALKYRDSRYGIEIAESGESIEVPNYNLEDFGEQEDGTQEKKEKESISGMKCSY